MELGGVSDPRATDDDVYLGDCHHSQPRDARFPEIIQEENLLSIRNESGLPGNNQPLPSFTNSHYDLEYSAHTTGRSSGEQGIGSPPRGSLGTRASCGEKGRSKISCHDQMAGLVNPNPRGDVLVTATEAMAGETESGSCFTRTVQGVRT